MDRIKNDWMDFLKLKIFFCAKNLLDCIADAVPKLKGTANISDEILKIIWLEAWAVAFNFPDMITLDVNRAILKKTWKLE